MWDKRNSESGIKIFRKWIEEDFLEEFKKFKDCDEEVLKFRKRSSQNKIKNYKTGTKGIQNGIPEDEKMGR